MNNLTDFILVGASIIDILAQPVDSTVFSSGSYAANRIAMHTGGDALNEATVLSSLGASVRLISKIGQDAAGTLILDHCRNKGIDISFLKTDPLLPTSINMVLIDPAGERSFITTPDGTLRRFYPEDIPDSALENGRYLCFASIFVAPPFHNLALQRFFAKAKAQDLILCADMTKCKNGEKIADMKDCLSMLDFIFPNYEEARLLTGLEDWDDIADAFLACGVKHVVLKAGSRGCFIKSTAERYWIEACPDVSCIDTTGAGDTFSACFLYAHNQGMTLQECGKFANAGASICIEQVGATGAIKNISQVLERYKKMQRS